MQRAAGGMQVPEGNANNSSESPMPAVRVELLCTAEAESGVDGLFVEALQGVRRSQGECVCVCVDPDADQERVWEQNQKKWFQWYGGKTPDRSADGSKCTTDWESQMSSPLVNGDLVCSPGSPFDNARCSW